MLLRQWFTSLQLTASQPGSLSWNTNDLAFVSYFKRYRHPSILLRTDLARWNSA